MKVLALSLTLFTLFTIVHKDVAVAMPYFNSKTINECSSSYKQQEQNAAAQQNIKQVQQTTAEIFDSMMYPLMAL
jgi:tRNA 2-selenouridine synthase SelU